MHKHSKRTAITAYLFDKRLRNRRLPHVPLNKDMWLQGNAIPATFGELNACNKLLACVLPIHQVLGILYVKDISQAIGRLLLLSIIHSPPNSISTRPPSYVRINSIKRLQAKNLHQRPLLRKMISLVRNTISRNLTTEPYSKSSGLR